jgi:hypothetical protein
MPGRDHTAARHFRFCYFIFLAGSQETRNGSREHEHTEAHTIGAHGFRSRATSVTERLRPIPGFLASCQKTEPSPLRAFA